MKIKVDQSLALSVTDVTQQLRKYAHELCKESGIKFKVNAYCSMLAAELANVQQYLDAAGEHRVLRLLVTLEKLCHVSSRGIDDTA